MKETPLITQNMEFTIRMDNGRELIEKEIYKLFHVPERLFGNKSKDPIDDIVRHLIKK